MISFKREKVINEGKNILTSLEKIAFKQVNFNYQTKSDFNLRHLNLKLIVDNL